MKWMKFDTALWAVSMGGLGAIVAYYVASTRFGVDLPFELALLGVGLVFLANGLLFTRWLHAIVGFVIKKEYLAAVMILLIGALVWNGFWLR